MIFVIYEVVFLENQDFLLVVYCRTGIFVGNLSVNIKFFETSSVVFPSYLVYSAVKQESR